MEPQQTKKIYLLPSPGNTRLCKEEPCSCPPFPLHKPIVVRQQLCELFLLSSPTPQRAGLASPWSKRRRAGVAQSFPKACGQIALGCPFRWVASQEQQICPSTLAITASVISGDTHALMISLPLPGGEPAHGGGRCSHSQISTGARWGERHGAVQSSKIPCGTSEGWSQ